MATQDSEKQSFTSTTSEEEELLRSMVRLPQGEATQSAKNKSSISKINKNSGSNRKRSSATFISVTDPAHAKNGHLRKIIRSHAAHIGHTKDVPDPRKPQNGRRSNGNVAGRRRPRHAVTFEIGTGQIRPAAQPRTEDKNERREVSTIPRQEAASSTAEGASLSSSSSLSVWSRPKPIPPGLLQLLHYPLDQRLGGGRVDHFRSYPVPWEPFFPPVIDYYLTKIVVDCEKLEKPENRGLLQSNWFPLAMTDAATFQVILLNAATQYFSIFKKHSLIPDLMSVRGRTIAYINRGLADKERCLSDGMVGAVAKMASFEAMFGEAETYKVHMEGLKRMIQLRGGLDYLGLNGLLAAIVRWVDDNSSIHLNAPRYFEPNTADNAVSEVQPNSATA